MLQKVNFRLTSVAQKRCCLSSLLTGKCDWKRDRKCSICRMRRRFAAVFQQHSSMSYLNFVPRVLSYPPPWGRTRSYTVPFILSKDVFERRTSTGSEAFSLFICLETTKFVLLSFFSPIKTIYLRVSTKPQPNAAKSPLPVDVRRSKTLLLKLPNFARRRTWELNLRLKN